MLSTISAMRRTWMTFCGLTLAGMIPGTVLVARAGISANESTPRLVARAQDHVTLAQLPANVGSRGTRPPGGIAPALPRHARDGAALARTKSRPNQTLRAPLHLAALKPAAAGTATTPLVAGFAGSTHANDIGSFGADQDVTPPDDNLAVSSTAVGEIVNNALLVTSRDGTRLSTIDLYSLFAIPTGWNVSDPRILFDSATSTWFVSTLAYSPDVSTVDIATAAGQDTPVTWTKVAVHPPSAFLDDQPKLGYSDDKVIVSWSDFDHNQSFAGEETWALQKADLIGRAASVRAVSLLGVDPSRFAPAPAQSLSPTSDAFLVYNNADPVNAVQNRSTPTLGVLSVVGTPATGVSVFEADPQLNALAAPPPASEGNGQWVDTGDDRLLSAVWLNGHLWTTADDACPGPRACARFIEALVSSGTAQVVPGQDWDVSAPGADYYYPAATFTLGGDMVASMTESTGGAAPTYPSVVVLDQAAGYAAGPSTTALVETGSTYYQDRAGAPTSRWGDYGGAAFDPSNLRGAWVVGEYVPMAQPSAHDNWGTWIEEVSLSGMPPPGGGYTLDGFGGVHPMGSTPAVTVTASWPGWDIARALTLNPCDSSRHSGWVLDGFGGLHPFGGAPTVTVSAYWPGWSIANDFAALPCTTGGHAVGYVLDGFGGLHTWYQSASDPPPAPAVTGYWPNWDIAIKLSGLPGTNGGYVMDGFGGLHPFNNATFYPPSGYWPNWTIARDIVAVNNGAGLVGGYTMDGFGGIHQFGNVPALFGTAYWPNWDIARAIDSPDAAGTGGGYALDGFGGVHPISASPFVAVSAYARSVPPFRDVVTAP